MPVEIIVPVPSVPIPLVSSTLPIVSPDHPLRREREPNTMPRHSSDSTDPTRESENHKKLYEKITRHCELWTICGHDVGSQEFMTAIAEAYIQLPSQQGKNYPMVSVGFGAQFFRHHHALETRRREAKRARSSDDSEKYWLSQLQKEIFDRLGFKFSQSCVYAAMDFGFITEFGRSSAGWTCHRPKILSRQPHSLASATLLVSLTGEFFPFRAMMKVPKKDPTKHRATYKIEVATNRKGWANDEDWVDWLTDYFDEQTKPFLKPPNEWRLLFVDTYLSPITEQFFVESLERRILCIAFPKGPKVDQFDPFRCGGICARLDRFHHNWMSKRLESARRNGDTRFSLDVQSFAGLIADICFREERKNESTTATREAWTKTTMYRLLNEKCTADGAVSGRENENRTSIRQRVQPQEPRPQTSGGDRDEPLVIDSDDDGEIPIHTPPSTNSSGGSSTSDSTIGNSDREFRQSSSRGRKRSRTPTMTPLPIRSPVSSRTRSRLRPGEPSRQEPGSPCPPNYRRRLSYGNSSRTIQTPRAQTASRARPPITEQRRPILHLSSSDEDSSDSSDSVSPDRPVFSSGSRNNQPRDNRLRMNQSRESQSRDSQSRNNRLRENQSRGNPSRENRSRDNRLREIQSRDVQSRNNRSRENLRLPPRTPKAERDEIIADYQRSRRRVKELLQLEETHEQDQAMRAMFQAGSSSPYNQIRWPDSDGS